VVGAQHPIGAAVLSFRQILAALPVELQSDALDPKPLAEPMPLDQDLLAQVSGGKSDIPGGGW
jgi:hypothetical protein